MNFESNISSCGGAVSGYTMEQCRQIVNHYPVRLMFIDQQDTDYPALLEIYRQYRYEKHTDLSMMAAAFALGHAIGVRDERARRRGVEVVPPNQAEIAAAEQAIKKAELDREILTKVRKLKTVELDAVLATMRAMSEGKTDAEAIDIGNAVLTAAGHKPVSMDVLNATPA